MEKNDIVELDIVRSGKDGEGVALYNNMVVFVPQAIVGERVKVSVVEIKKNYARAKVIKILEASKNRITPLCPVFYKCGGCDMQHIFYEKQLEIKKTKIESLLSKNRIDAKVEDIVKCENQFGYRNKAQIPLQQEKDGRIKLGYYRKGSHSIVEFARDEDAEKLKKLNLGRCPLHSAQMQLVIDTVFDFIGYAKIPCYDENSRKGLLRHICVRQIDNCFSVTLVVNGDNLPSKRLLIDRLRDLNVKFSLFININTRNTNVIYGDKTILLYGDERCQGDTLGIKYEVSPTSFLQVNNEMRDKLYEFVNSMIIEGENIIDCFSGIGILSNVLTKKAGKVIAIEINKDAVKDADNIAILNKSKDKIINFVGDAVEILPKVVKKYKATQIVLDPPRKGLDKVIVDVLLDVLPQGIIYISCEPSTLIRDLKLLQDGYTIKTIKPFDMFPQCSGVETVVVLSKKQ